MGYDSFFGIEKLFYTLITKTMAFTLPELPYAYDALEPTIDAKTMEVHHSKHHQAYVDKLNAAIKDTERDEKSLEEILQSLDILPANIKNAVRNNWWGVWNHNIFWKTAKAPGLGIQWSHNRCSGWKWKVIWIAW